MRSGVVSGMAFFRSVGETGLAVLAIGFFVTCVHKLVLGLRAIPPTMPLLELVPWRRSPRLALLIAAVVEAGICGLLAGANGLGMFFAVLLLGMYSTQLARLPASAPCDCFPLRSRLPVRLDARHGVRRNMLLVGALVILWILRVDARSDRLLSIDTWHYSAPTIGAGFVIAALLYASAVFLAADTTRPDPFRKVAR